jgi:DNA-binding GntR family transcriptional regulator
MAEAARRASVSHATAAKWRRRYLDGGIGGLDDVPCTGRPPIPDVVLRRILSCTLDEPPAGALRWTTRSVSAATGVSQATVSRTRRRYFPRSGPTEDVLDNRASILAYVGIHPSGCVLGFHAAAGTRGTPASPARTDAVETIVCAALLRRPILGDDGAAQGDAVTVLRRAAERLPPMPAATLVLDVALDATARSWLLRHPEITVHSVTGADWLGLLHHLADAIDPGQLAELQEVQRRIRLVRRDPAVEFVWSRDEGASSTLTAGLTPQLEAEPLAHDLIPVIHAVCAAIADGELHAGEAISVRRVARRSGVSAGRVADALARLATEALIDKQAGRYLVPAPTPRDVAETYTARGLLGTAITRRLASTGIELPPILDEHQAGLVRCHELGLTADACSIDLDLQDELARAAAMPRIGSMFVRLTLQLRLFLAIFGLDYRYPTDEIVTDDQRILAEIRRRDPESAVEAWRSKIDNCARYMLGRLRPMT